MDVFARATPEHKLRLLQAPALSRDGLMGNRYVLLAITLVLGFQALFTYLPVMQHVFGTTGLEGASWTRILAFGVSLFFLVEIEKWLIARIWRQPQVPAG